MINSINSLTTKPGDASSNEAVGRGKVSSSAPEPKTAETQSDSVEISASAQQLGQLIQQVSALPDIDVDRIATLRAAIEQGHYSIDADALAQRIIDLES